jgi:hypothetical protein
MANKFQICAQACVMIGEQPITSFGDGTSASIACSNLYESTVQDQMSRYRWRFAVGQRQLNRLSDRPPTRWDAAYQLPSDCMTVNTVLVNGHPVHFDRFEDMIFCNASSADSVFLEGVYRVDEAFWPPYFTMIIIYHMAALLAQTLGADGADVRGARTAAGQRGALA